jgi:hypothetical protein
MTIYLCPIPREIKKYDVSQWIRCKGWQQNKRGRKSSCIRIIQHENQKKVVIVFRLFRRGVCFIICITVLIHCSGIESRWGRDFSHLFRPALGLTQPPVQWVPGRSWG